MILFFRIICDIFWQVKELSIILNIVAFVYAFYLLSAYKIVKSQFHILVILFLLALIYSFAYLKSPSDTSFKIYFKLIGSLSIPIIGFYIFSINKTLKILTVTSYLIIFVNLLFSFIGIGYKLWGNVNTFSGIYFFKTDLALSSLICLVFILASDVKYIIFKFIFVIAIAYLVFLSNSRAYYIIFLVIIFLYYFQNIFFTNPVRSLLISIPILLISAYTLFTVISLFSTSNILLVSFSKTDFFSEYNTQGRSVIWQILLSKFFEYSFIEKFYGLGLDADINLMKRFGKSEEVYNSHNTFLYLIISTGFLGLVTFIFLITLFFRKLIINSKFFLNSNTHSKLLFLSFSHFFIFFISSLSNATIIFQQETWFFFFFLGIMYNNIYFKHRSF
jgi:O-antigen ligase